MSNKSHEGSSDDEYGEEKPDDGFKFSAQGKKMAASIAKYMLMRYFFPDLDRKKQQRASNDFLVDMKFDLSKGSITKATTKLNNRKFLVRDFVWPTF